MTLAASPDDAAAEAYARARYHAVLGETDAALASLGAAIDAGFYRVDRLCEDRYAALRTLRDSSGMMRLIDALVTANRAALAGDDG